MGRSHALSGAAVGLWVAPLAGLTDIAAAVPFATVVAGYAIAPDIDCGGATVSRLLGPVTKLLSKLCVAGSKRIYAATATERDDHSASAGGHRGVTHLIVTALLLGLLAGLTSLASPWVVAGWAGFGLLAAATALGDWVFLAGGAAFTVPLVADGLAPVQALAAMQPWLGPAVTLGMLTHLAGDDVTVTGLPLLAPLVKIQGQRWHDLHLLPAGFRLHTGRKVENLLVLPAFAAATVAAVLTFPGIGDLLAGLDLHTLTTALPGAHAAATGAFAPTSPRCRCAAANNADRLISDR